MDKFYTQLILDNDRFHTNDLISDILHVSAWGL